MKEIIACVYSIRNIKDNKMYIGSAVNFYKRKKEHGRLLMENRHHAIRLQDAWNQYGSKCFVFEILERVEKSKTLEREQFYIDNFRSYDPICGYNTNPTAKSWLGAHHRESTKKIISEKRMGWKMTDRHKQIMRKSASHPHDLWRRMKKCGSGNPNAKLSSPDVENIKALLNSGEKVSPIAKKYHVAYQTIWEIKKGMAWVYLGLPKDLIPEA